ncbi:hypothetical protein P7L70_20570 [Tistrella mobilis]|uniref:hypothetical protein n=1 Tax=Tistrella mobilis TaxID=171437 RepID=UPI00355768B1
MTGSHEPDAALLRLMRARGLAAKYAVLDAEGETLLSPQAEDRLAPLARGNLDEAGRDLHLGLLRACREHGLGKGSTIFVNALIDVWLHGDDWDGKIALLEDWSDILLADQVAERLKAFAQKDIPLRERVVWHTDLLKRCRTQGIAEGADTHNNAAGRTPPATPKWRNDPAALMEELSRLDETDVPDNWSRRVTILESMLSTVSTAAGNEAEVLRATFSSDLATTYQKLLEAGMVDPSQILTLRIPTHALYDEALDIRRRHQHWIKVAHTASNQATILQREFYAGDANAAPRAHALYDEALEILRRDKRWSDVARAANNKASLLSAEFNDGDANAAQRAHALYDEALDIHRRHQRWGEMAGTAQNQACLLLREFEAGNASAAPRAHALFNEALEIFRRHQIWGEVAKTASNQATLLHREFDTGDTSAAQRAHALYDEALDIRRRHKRWIEVAHTRYATHSALRHY